MMVVIQLESLITSDYSEEENVIRCHLVAFVAAGRSYVGSVEMKWLYRIM